MYINVDLFISFIDSFDYTFPPDFPLFLQQQKKNYLWPRWTASNLTKKRFYKNKFLNIQIFSLTTVATTKKLEKILEK